MCGLNAEEGRKGERPKMDEMEETAKVLEDAARKLRSGELYAAVCIVYDGVKYDCYTGGMVEPIGMMDAFAAVAARMIADIEDGRSPCVPFKEDTS